MSDNTHIEWADATVNAINGCSVTSPGCTHCYAMKLAGTRLRDHPTRNGLTTMTKAGPVWNGKVRLHEPALLQPLKWKRPRRILWNAHGDTFHDSVPDAWIDRVFAVAALTPQHTHMILTKRSKRMREYLTRHRWHLWAAIGREIDAKRWAKLPPIMGGDCTPVPNVWLGVSVEDQTRADERIPDLLATPASVRFLSCEPLLGPVSLAHIPHPKHEGMFIDALDGHSWGYTSSPLDSRSPVDWVIAGGESGPGARPMHPDWARSLRDQCTAAGVPFHFKQWGEWLPVYDREATDPDWRKCSAIEQMYPGGRWLNLSGGHGFDGERVHWVHKTGKKLAGRMLDGAEYNGLPA
ncbi:MAG: phage Gp37/Gp68 family protein [Pseudomonadota bacterium]